METHRSNNGPVYIAFFFNEKLKMSDIEIKHVHHLGSMNDIDYHMVKYNLHHTDGSTTAHYKPYKDFNRTFYVTKKPYRDHKQHKIIEDREHCYSHDTTESNLANSVARALNYRGKPYLRGMMKNPYLYDTYLPSTVLLMNETRVKNPDLVSPSTYGTYDIETGMVNGQVLITSIGFDGVVYTYIHSEFLGEGSDQYKLEKLHKLRKKHLTKFEDLGYKFEYHLVKTEAEVIINPIMKLHELKPDIVGVWNIRFDIPFVLDRMEVLGIDPKTVFTDPSIPKDLQKFTWKEGRSERIKTDGTAMRLDFSERWHEVHAFASYEWQDQMILFRLLRSQEAKRGSYSLDAIAKEILGWGKFQIPGLEHLSGADFHIVGQRDYPYEYVMYSQGDIVPMLEIDKITLDMSTKLPNWAGLTSLQKFGYSVVKGNTNYIMDLINEGKYCVGNIPPDREASEVLPRSGWIVTAIAGYLKSKGVSTVNIGHVTRIYKNILDLDLVSSYPSIIIAMLVSYLNTISALHRIVGLKDDEVETLLCSVFGKNEAVHFCENIGYPDILTLSKEWDAEKSVD